MEDALGIYNDYLSIGDKRVEDWPLMKTPVITIVILVAYFIVIYVIKVVKILKKNKNNLKIRFLKILIKVVMARRTPFDLKGFLYFYNFLQVLVSLYISSEVIYHDTLKTRYND